MDLVRQLGMEDALLPGIMLTQTEEFRPEEIFRAYLPACTREEAAELLDSLWCDYQSLSLRARSQVKILMSALTTMQANSDLR